jgi:2-polyprenyl-6-methoxyphenol hydroxylase-like FAD-dependent oxidoreductase
LAGLFTATLLRKAGWHTEVFERSHVELIGRGAGITTHPELLQSLVRSDADLNDLGVHVHERIALDAGGRVVDRLPYEQIVPRGTDGRRSISRLAVGERRVVRGPTAVRT